LAGGGGNPNGGSRALAPVATEIETQVVRWLAELVGFGAPCGGIMVSGGNMANFLGFLAARHAKAPWNLRAEGVGRIDTACHRGNAGAWRFYARQGFRPLDEERLALLL
jgi:hypothetical protein